MNKNRALFGFSPSSIAVRFTAFSAVPASAKIITTTLYYGYKIPDTILPNPPTSTTGNQYLGEDFSAHVVYDTLASGCGALRRRQKLIAPNYYVNGLTDTANFCRGS